MIKEKTQNFLDDQKKFELSLFSVPTSFGIMKRNKTGQKPLKDIQLFATSPPGVTPVEVKLDQIIFLMVTEKVKYISEEHAKLVLAKGTTWFWQQRKFGTLPYSKVGGTVFYRISDIISLLDTHYQTNTDHE